MKMCAAVGDHTEGEAVDELCSSAGARPVDETAAQQGGVRWIL